MEYEQQLNSFKMKNLLNKIGVFIMLFIGYFLLEYFVFIPLPIFNGYQKIHLAIITALADVMIVVGLLIIINKLGNDYRNKRKDK